MQFSLPEVAVAMTLGVAFGFVFLLLTVTVLVVRAASQVAQDATGARPDLVDHQNALSLSQSPSSSPSAVSLGGGAQASRDPAGSSEASATRRARQPTRCALCEAIRAALRIKTKDLTRQN